LENRPNAGYQPAPPEMPASKSGHGRLERPLHGWVGGPTGHTLETEPPLLNLACWAQNLANTQIFFDGHASPLFKVSSFAICGSLLESRPSKPAGPWLGSSLAAGKLRVALPPQESKNLSQAFWRVSTSKRFLDVTPKSSIVLEQLLLSADGLRKRSRPCRRPGKRSPIAFHGRWPSSQ